MLPPHIDPDVIALMELVGLLTILVASRKKQLREAKLSQLRKCRITITEKYPENTTSILSIHGMVVLQKFSIPPSGGMSHVVANRRVLELVMSTRTYKQQTLFVPIHHTIILKIYIYIHQ